MIGQMKSILSRLLLICKDNSASFTLQDSLTLWNALNKSELPPDGSDSIHTWAARLRFQPRTYHHHPRWGEHSQQIRDIRRPPTTTAPWSPGPSQLWWWRQQELLCCCEKHRRSIVIRLGRRHPALRRREKGSLRITRLLLFGATWVVAFAP